MRPVFIFDMSGVLLDFDLDAIKQRVAASCGLPVAEVDRTWRDDPYQWSETGQMSSREYYAHYCSRIGLSWPYEQWVAEWARICSPYEMGMELFRPLKAKYPVYVLSNLAEYHKEAAGLAVPGFWEASCGNFLSYEMGLCKPSAEIYRAACARIGALPSACYYFDDDEINVRGAGDVGMRAFHFCPAKLGAVRAALEQYGIR